MRTDPPSSSATAPTLAVSVKSLCAFAAKSGDLDLRFVPAPSAQEGMAGHRLVQAPARRGLRDAKWRSPRASAGCRCAAAPTATTPRAAGVEEIKTFRGDFAAIQRQPSRAALGAGAQLRLDAVRGATRCPRIEVALVYLDLATGEEIVLAERCTREALRDALRGALRALPRVGRAGGRASRASSTRRSAALAFPHARLPRRPARAGAGRLPLGRRAALPAGAGAHRHRQDGRHPVPAAQGAAGAAHRQDLLPHGQDLRAARSRSTPAPARAADARRCACSNSRRARRSASTRAAPATAKPARWRAASTTACRRRAREAVQAALARSRGAARRIALAHQVCPYFLAQEMARWSDVIVGDYNYYFDGSAFLYALTKEEEWRVALLVDEAHNLLDRARGMYCAQLEAAALDAGAAPGAAPASSRRWASCSASGTLLQRDQVAAYQAHDEHRPSASQRALQEAVAAMAEHFAARPDEAARPAAAVLLRRCCTSPRLADSFGKHSVFECHARRRRARGARHPQPGACALPRSSASPTAHRPPASRARWRPSRFYRDTLGLPEDTATLDVGSPFRSEQLTVRVAMDVSTRFRDRDRSLAALVGIIARPVRRASRQLPRLLQQLRLPRQRRRRPSRRGIPRCRRGRSRAACARPSAKPSWRASQPAAAASASRCSAARSARASTCRATGWSAPSSPAWACRSTTSRTRSCASACSAVRRRLRVHLRLSRPAEGGAGGRPRHPHRRGRGRAVPAGRPLRAAGDPRAAAGLVGRAALVRPHRAR